MQLPLRATEFAKTCLGKHPESKMTRSHERCTASSRRVRQGIKVDIPGPGNFVDAGRTQQRFSAESDALCQASLSRPFWSRDTLWNRRARCVLCTVPRPTARLPNRGIYAFACQHRVASKWQPSFLRSEPQVCELILKSFARP